jgi:PAS domain S-box-containing protein
MQAQVYEYRLIAEAIPQIVWISDPQGLAEFFNARWFEYTGLGPDECVGDGWAQAVHPSDAAAAIALRLTSLESGEMFETEFRLRRTDGVYRWFLVRALPMRDPAGVITMWMGTCTDIEQQKRAELQLRFLLEAGRALAASLDPSSLARDLAKLVVPQMADYCQIFALESGALAPLAIVHHDPAIASVLHEIDERFPISPESPAIQYLFEAREPVAVPDVTQNIRDMSARSPEHLVLLNKVGARSSIVVPLLAGDRPCGLLSMVYAESGRRYGAEDIGVAREIGARLAAALENASRYQRERRVADTLQDAMLPNTLPRVEGARLHHNYQPGESDLQVGGDWYDAFELPDGTIGISIGDVTGHGLAAAVVMGEIRQAIRSAAIEAIDPRGVLDHADRTLRLAHPDTIATAGFGIYTPSTRTLRYAQAGHPLPLICDPDGSIATLHAEGLPLGMRDLGTGTQTEAVIAHGALVALYTDGLVEFDRDAEVGERDLRAALRAERADTSANPALGIYRRINTARRQLADDVAILTLQIE